MKTKLCNAMRPLALGVALTISSMAHAAVVPLDRVVAIVDNDVVMESQLRQRLTEVKQNIAKRGGEVPPDSAVESQVLERLILEDIQLQIAERSGIRISEDELNQAVATIAQRNGLSVAQFRQALAQDGLTYDDVRDQVRRELTISRVRQRQVAQRIQISQQEVQNFLNSDLGRIQLSEEYRLANILIPVADSASSSEIQAAGQKAMQIYNKARQGADFGELAIANSAGDNALDGGEIGWRKAAQLPPPFDQMISSMKPGDVTEPARVPGGIIILKVEEKRGGESSVVDEVHVRHILLKPNEIRSDEETRRLAERLRERIEGGEDFAELAKSFSEDPGSALNGGDLNWINPESLVPEFREVMNSTSAGQLSQPFRTQYGWHILEVLGRRATDNSEQVRQQQALNLLRNRKYDQELQLWLRQIRDEAYVEIKK
ncbi:MULTISPECIES: peptidylprolyl isomerase [Pseudomonas]|uniref:Chaperone SurA n=1 Tax=Pseudomonas luteola TaxID=47886 RepID=A0ABS0FKX8_PSELU|nr:MULTISPECIES: peptidylprolyl isomerase [Pseudomonas]MBF8640982.1 peptidylprolyl isomerase [Pseudomonas zeshuii]RRW48895.1 molecular chaperone SurA [Pseudomonas luteola]